MGLKKLSEKIVEYRKRLERGKASEIKLDHVEKTLTKLRKKKSDLEAEIADTRNANKKHRLERKVKIAKQQMKRAEWLKSEIS